MYVTNRRSPSFAEKLKISYPTGEYGGTEERMKLPIEIRPYPDRIPWRVQKRKIEWYFHEVWREIKLTKFRVQLWWVSLWIREDEVHPTLDFNGLVTLNMTRAQRRIYETDLVRRRNKAHERDLGVGATSTPPEYFHRALGRSTENPMRKVLKFCMHCHARFLGLPRSTRM